MLLPFWIFTLPTPCTSKTCEAMESIYLAFRRCPTVEVRCARSRGLLQMRALLRPRAAPTVASLSRFSAIQPLWALASKGLTGGIREVLLQDVSHKSEEPSRPNAAYAGEQSSGCNEVSNLERRQQNRVEPVELTSIDQPVTDASKAPVQPSLSSQTRSAFSDGTQLLPWPCL